MSESRKGIILAGGKGTRLSPLSIGVSKQILPIYDKPLIYYPLSTLMLGGMREIMIITTPEDLDSFKRLLGDGKSWGIEIQYAIQKKAEGVAQALLIAEHFIKESSSALILGDNLFYGNQLVDLMRKADKFRDLATIFTYPVKDPENYGVVKIDNKGNPKKIIEKPKDFVSRFAITGLYYQDYPVIDKAKRIKPSERGELEISCINQLYLNEKKLKIIQLGRGLSWLDTGSIDSLHEAGSYIKTIEHRQGLKIGCPEEIAWRLGWINDNQLEVLAAPLMKSGYGDYLIQILNEKSLIDNYFIKYRQK